jgi:AraC family carnitine catabolism transcriptional activator
MLAFFAALEPLRLANQLIGWRHHAWRIYTTDGCLARASCGMSVPADSGPEATADRDAPGCVIVISGFDPWPQPDRRLKNWLRGLDRRGASLGAVDTGASVLAAAHLLGSVRTSVHWESAGALRELFPELILSDRPTRSRSGVFSVRAAPPCWT